MARLVFVLGALVACAPQMSIESLPPQIEEEATSTGPHPSLLPEIAPRSAGSELLRIELDDTYPKIRRRLRSTRPRRIQKGLEELERIEDTMFPDRIALLEGQAHERLTNFEEARRAYAKAIRLAAAPAVREQAARGMVSVLGHLGEHTKRLEYLDALIALLSSEPDWQLLILRAETLHDLGRTREAQDALRSLIREYPNARTAQQAEERLLVLTGRRKLSYEDERTRELAKVRWLAETRRSRQALRVLKQWKRKQKRIDPETALLEADLWRSRGQRWRAQSILQSLVKSKDPTLRSGAMLRLARICADRYQYGRARRQFAAVIEQFPGSPDAIAAELEAAQIEFDSDEYGAAATKMRAFALRHPNHELAAKAAWLAGFSARLAGTSSLAIDSFERFIAEETNHPAAPRVRYWLARELETIGERERAAELYGWLVERTPLGYYGLLAEQRLQGMGVSVALNPLPPVPSPQTVEEVVSLMGPGRPLAVDRATALFDARLNREGVEELLGLADYFRTSGDTQGATLVVDLFQIFGRNAWASLLARHIAEGDNPDDLERRPYYWRVWRYAFPMPFEEEVRSASQANGVDPFLIYSVMRTESRFRADAVSPVGARGLMQLMPATARWIGRQERRAKLHARRYRRPDSNVWLGSWYIRFLLDHYEGDVSRALGAYNAGPAAVDRWTRRFDGFDPDELIERIPYEETRAYVQRALESYLVYQRLHPEPSVAQTEEPDTARGS